MREGLYGMEKRYVKRNVHTMSHSSKNYMAYKDWVVADTTHYYKTAFDTYFIQLISTAPPTHAFI